MCPWRTRGSAARGVALVLSGRVRRAPSTHRRRYRSKLWRSRTVSGGEFESRRSEPAELRSLRACLRLARSRGSNSPGVGASTTSVCKPSRVGASAIGRPCARKSGVSRCVTERSELLPRTSVAVARGACRSRARACVSRFRKLDCQNPDTRHSLPRDCGRLLLAGFETLGCAFGLFADAVGVAAAGFDPGADAFDVGFVAEDG